MLLLDALSTYLQPTPPLPTTRTRPPAHPSHLEAGESHEAALKSAAAERVGFQQRVTNKLQPHEVAPDDRSWGASWQRFKNVALSGVATNVFQVHMGRVMRGASWSATACCLAGSRS